ncbi:FAS1-like dehydratase domain-containing protein [Sphingomonas immobilis]|uniref:MaoC family dehydratase N-terminal domain-containing protein n=1 Tax=Sphingomonas immobilis TaxID=3063997 RepID=A0ABT8ZXI8_9SPHN|nr:MaoC family dehydratase N-terminal domain-containing protein [Sphingomonas sp. CA1-15]MDO7842281.1 MaoC family dehydratase N-terminal domain-containing protein [Sphingomonas sp. CA1-15]
MTQASFLTPQVMSIVGEQTEPRHGKIDAHQIRKFAAAIDDPNPIFTDESAARAAGFAGIVAPPLFNASATRPVPFRSGLLADGQYDSAAPPGLTHLQTMLAGQHWDLVRPAIAGEDIVEVFTTKSITEKQGKTGNIVFVEKEATLTTPAGEVIERYGSTLILRAPPPPLPPYAAPEGEAAATASRPATEWTDDGFIKSPDMVTMFMFAAAIWGVHRIHWDTPYAQAEGLPLPILPGWGLSSYLAELAGSRAPAGQRLRRIDVRYRSSAFPGDALHCTAAPAAEGEGDLALGIVNQHGAQVATGSAAFSD